MLSAFAHGESWDVTETGQPFVEVEIAVEEGTWMSVDISPDGKTLLFDLLGDIYRLPSAGGDAELLHGGPAIEIMPSFSPDGRTILFLSDASGSDNVWTSDVDGRRRRQVTHETTDVLAGPTWDATGEYVAAAKRYGTFPAMRASEIRLFHVGSRGSGRLLVETPPNGRDVHEASFSPDGKFLYYTQRIGSPNIFVDANHKNFGVMRRDLATGDAEQILNGFGSATTAQVSSDGKRLAFVRRVKNKTVLFGYDTETRRQRPVYDELDRGLHADYMQQNAYYPRFDWFPDNRHVAIWGKGRLLRVDMDSGEASEIPFRAVAKHRITKPARFETDLAPDRFQVRVLRDLAFAPDGNRFVFNALGRLWYDYDSRTTPVRLTRSEDFEYEPAFARDGRSIAYVAWNDESGSRLIVADRDGRNARTVASSSGVIRQPAFSPDGDRLVYRIDAPSKYMGGYRAKSGIYWTPVRNPRSRFVSANGTAPQFALNGDRIFFSYISSGDEDEIYASAGYSVLESVNLQGNDPQRHATGTDVLELRLSPDNGWLAFRHQKQYYLTPYVETGRPYRLSARGDEFPVVKLTAIGGNNLVWSHDSSAVYWTLGNEVYRADVADALSGSYEPDSRHDSVSLTVKTDVPAGTLVFRNATIITLDDADRVIDDGVIVVTGNRIVAIGADGEVAIPEDATSIDVTGKTIMPGLVDMHGHIDCCHGESDVMPQKQPSRYAALAFGVTTNFDPYSSDLPAYAINEMNLAGITVGPRAVNVGSVVYGRSQKYDFAFAPVRSLADAHKVMARKKALGGTIIKSYKQPMRSQRQQLVRAGREAGIMVDVEGEIHFYNNISMILDGHVALEHNLPVATYYDDLVQLFAHSGVAHTPTLVNVYGELLGESYIYQTRRNWEDDRVRTFVQEVTAGYSPIDTPSGAPPHVRAMSTIHAADEIWDVGFRSVSRSMRRLDEAGVPVNAGSHGQVAGLAMHWELRLLAEGGMSNMHVLRAGTINGATTLGLDSQIGSLETGKLADLIILDKNPLEDIENSMTVRYTMVNGRLYDAYSMNEIGNYDRPRSRFYWELDDTNGIDWEESWSE